MKTLIADIKRNALDDGPGIRTVIFFKGCPLTCVWCQNPETKSPFLELSFEKKDCSQCGTCIAACDLDAVDFNNPYRINRDICNLCGVCIERCPNDALKFVGMEHNIDELVSILLKDKIFYRNSGGGVTLSGGEPTLHNAYLKPLLETLREENISVCLETCGHFDFETVDATVLPYIDLLFFDLKLFDDGLHKQYCGVSNQTIFRNFERLLSAKNRVEILPRIPLIPGITATDDNLIALAGYLNRLGINNIDLLPYNQLWLSKADKIGRKIEYSCSAWLEKEQKNRIKSIFSDFTFNDF